MHEGRIQPQHEVTPNEIYICILTRSTKETLADPTQTENAFARNARDGHLEAKYEGRVGTRSGEERRRLMMDFKFVQMF